MSFPSFTAGRRLRASELTQIITEIQARLLSAFKPVDESLATNTTLQNDDDLFAAVEANSTYRVLAWLPVNSPTAADIKWLASGPAGSTFPHSLVASTGGSGVFSSPLDHGATSSFTTDTRDGIAVPDTQMLYGTLFTAGTAGTFRLTWAQNASSGTTIVLKGAWLSLTKMP